MQILKERALRSYYTYRFAAIAGLAVAITAVCASPSFARHHNNNQATTTETAQVTTVSPNGVTETTVSTATTGIDYRILADPDMDHFAIKRAMAFGMTDSQIAQAAKLAHYAMEPMGVVLDRIEDGRTIADLAMQYGVSLDTVMDASDWQDRINDYMTAYDDTGLGAIKHGPPAPVVSSYTTTTPGMAIGPAAVAPNGATISPNGTTVEPNGATVAPNGTTVTPNGATIAPNGTTVSPGGTTTAPNGTTVGPGGTTIAPNGTTVTPGGTTTTPSGTTVQPNGATNP